MMASPANPSWRLRGDSEAVPERRSKCGHSAFRPWLSTNIERKVNCTEQVDCGMPRTCCGRTSDMASQQKLKSQRGGGSSLSDLYVLEISPASQLTRRPEVSGGDAGRCASQDVSIMGGFSTDAALGGRTIKVKPRSQRGPVVLLHVLLPFLAHKANGLLVAECLE